MPRLVSFRGLIQNFPWASPPLHMQSPLPLENDFHIPILQHPRLFWNPLIPHISTLPKHLLPCLLHPFLVWLLYLYCLRTVPTIVIVHPFCASRDTCTRVSYCWCLPIQGYFCMVLSSSTRWGWVLVPKRWKALERNWQHCTDGNHGNHVSANYQAPSHWNEFSGILTEPHT